VKQLVVATNNNGKIKEIRVILRDLSYAIVSVTEFDPDFYVEEDGATYIENAVKKARSAAIQTGCLAIADDSGLEVDALDGAPGLYSARFGGGKLSQSEKNALLLQKLHGVSERSARFRCVIAVVSPDGRIETTEGLCEGIIGQEERGSFGFGFDPVFIVPEYQKTMAELGPEMKNSISHRARALQQLPEILERFSA
jgi:XTP/dITP diphosphohydrolase